MNVHYSYSFLVLLTRIQLQEIIPGCDLQSFSAIPGITAVSKSTPTDIFLRAINSNYRYRIVLPEGVLSIAETDLWECWQKISHADTEFPLNSILFPKECPSKQKKF